MKRLQDYLNKNFDSIYENFEADHKLTEEEINKSMNKIINEGFWDFLTSFFKSIFGDGVTPEHRDYAARAMRFNDEEFGKEADKAFKELGKCKKADELIKETEMHRKRLVMTNIMKEDKSYAWAGQVVLGVYIERFDGEDRKKIEEKIEEYKQKAGKAWKDLESDIEDTENPDKDEENNNAATPPTEKFGKAFAEAVKQHENTVKELCTKCNTTPETVQKVVYEICSEVKETQNITDPNVVFGLILMTIGGYMTKGFKDREKIVSTFMGTIAMLLSQKKLKIKNQAL